MQRPCSYRARVLAELRDVRKLQPVCRVHLRVYERKGWVVSWVPLTTQEYKGGVVENGTGSRTGEGVAPDDLQKKYGSLRKMARPLSGVEGLDEGGLIYLIGKSPTIIGTEVAVVVSVQELTKVMFKVHMGLLGVQVADAPGLKLEKGQ